MNDHRGLQSCPPPVIFTASPCRHDPFPTKRHDQNSRPRTFAAPATRAVFLYLTIASCLMPIFYSARRSICRQTRLVHRSTEKLRLGLQFSGRLIKLPPAPPSPSASLYRLKSWDLKHFSKIDIVMLTTGLTSQVYIILTRGNHPLFPCESHQTAAWR